MKYSLRTQGIKLTDLDRGQLDEKIDRLKTHLQPPFVMDVSVIHEKLRSQGDSVTCKITVEQGKKVFHAERVNSSVQNALDETISAVRKELKKEHDKQKSHGGDVQR